MPRKGQPLVGIDASPSYIRHPGAAAALARLYGPARLARTTIVLAVRDPTPRTHSDFYQVER